MNSHMCSGCGQPHIVKLAHKEYLNKQKLTMLKRAAGHVIQTSTNNFMVRDIATESEFKMFNNFQKLRYHGLVTPVRDATNRRMKGRWLITRNGWAFLRGEIELPKYVLVKDNSIDSRADTTLGVRDVYRGSEAIETRFEYFDDSGQMVGLKPAISAPSPIQRALL